MKLLFFFLTLILFLTRAGGAAGCKLRRAYADSGVFGSDTPTRFSDRSGDAVCFGDEGFGEVGELEDFKVSGAREIEVTVSVTIVAEWSGGCDAFVQLNTLLTKPARRKRVEEGRKLM